jgi:hypothetical protein
MSRRTFKQALIKVRILIESGEQQFICHALEAVGARRYVHRIMDLLGRDTYGREQTYYTWVANNFPDTDWDRSQIRVGRLAWIDDLISKEAA